MLIYGFSHIGKFTLSEYKVYFSHILSIKSKCFKLRRKLYFNKNCSRILSSTVHLFCNMESDENKDFVLDKRPFTCVTEGLAQVNFPSTQDVFYNPVQEFNRDMSVAVIRLHASDYKIIQEDKLSHAKTKPLHGNPYIKISEDDFEMVQSNTDILSCGVKDENGIRILEALAASGLRSIRYAKEAGGIKEILANDISKQAVECMNTNIENNEVQHIVKASLNDASLVMYQHRGLNERFTTIDLDPYGSPHAFLDAAVQSIVDGGLLLVTCTDMAVLCGNSPETCYIKYGALSMKHRACHEMALRIVLQCIEANANKYGRYIVPLLSMSVDFYCRLFVRVFTSQKKCKETFSKLSWVHQCTTCESTTFQPLGNVVKNGASVKYQLSTPKVGPTCSHCGGTHRTAGPIWAAPIHDKNFVSRLKSTINSGTPFNTARRMEGTLTMIEEELLEVPLYIVFDKIFKILRMPCFKMKEFISAILNAGYKVSPTHAAKNGIKTNAPYSVLWDILRAREKLYPIKKEHLDERHPARRILQGNKDWGEKRIHSNETNFNNNHSEISFKEHPNATFESEKSKVLRFQQNPQQFWGPKARAVTSLYHGDLQEKSKRYQGTRKKAKKLKTDHEDDSNIIQKDLDNDTANIM